MKNEAIWTPLENALPHYTRDGFSRLGRLFSNGVEPIVKSFAKISS